MGSASPLRPLLLLLTLAACDCESWLATRRGGSLPPVSRPVEAIPERRELAAPRVAPPTPATAPGAPSAVLPPKMLVPPADVTRALTTPPPPPAATPSDETEEEGEQDDRGPAPRAATAPMPPGLPALKLPGGFGRPQLLRPGALQVDPRTLRRPPTP
ncbi:MAG: hypothetical protein RL199_453 [Pseudomonadota bacterium]|jgi:hypothetical protein